MQYGFAPGVKLQILSLHQVGNYTESAARRQLSSGAALRYFTEIAARRGLIIFEIIGRKSWHYSPRSRQRTSNPNQQLHPC